MKPALEPAIWACDTSQRMRCFDSCQLTMILWQSTKANVQVVDRLFGKQASKGPHVVQLRMYAHAMRPRANAAYRDDHEKRDAWVSYFYAWFSLVCPISIGMGLLSCGPSGRRSSAIIRPKLTKACLLIQTPNFLAVPRTISGKPINIVSGFQVKW